MNSFKIRKNFVWTVMQSSPKMMLGNRTNNPNSGYTGK